MDPWVREILLRRKWTPLQYSYLGKPMYRGARKVTVHGVAESDTTEHIRIHIHAYTDL